MLCTLLLTLELHYIGSIGIYITTIYEEIGITNIYESTLFFSLACVPGHVISTLLVDRVGRKTVFSCGMLFSAITLMYFSWLSASDRSSHSFQIIATSCMVSFLFPFRLIKNYNTSLFQYSVW